MVCHSGTGLVPTVDDRVYHFAHGGLYNGLFLMGDDETGSYWDHITGECVHGQLHGTQLEVFPIVHTSAVQAVQTYPDIEIALSRLPWWMRLMGLVMSRQAHSRGFLPPFFRRTMAPVDARLPEMTSGLGVWDGSVRRFYPVDRLRRNHDPVINSVNGRRLLVYLEPGDQIPQAIWLSETDQPEIPPRAVNRERPMQLFTRWYGFVLTFPNCEIYGE